MTDPSDDRLKRLRGNEASTRQREIKPSPARDVAINALLRNFGQREGEPHLSRRSLDDPPPTPTGDDA